jgi:hypothetical protein
MVDISTVNILTVNISAVDNLAVKILMVDISMVKILTVDILAVYNPAVDVSTEHHFHSCLFAGKLLCSDVDSARVKRIMNVMDSYLKVGRRLLKAVFTPKVCVVRPNRSCCNCVVRPKIR